MEKIKTKKDLVDFFTNILKSKDSKFDIDGVALLDVTLKNDTLIRFNVNDKNLVSIGINVRGSGGTYLSFFSYELTKLIWNTQAKIRSDLAIYQLNDVLSSLQDIYG